jgi:hypothetical protein
LVLRLANDIELKTNKTVIICYNFSPVDNGNFEFPRAEFVPLISVVLFSTDPFLSAEIGGIGLDERWLIA